MAKIIKTRAFMFESLDFDTAKTLSYRKEVYHKTMRDLRGYPVVARVNGAVKLWKTRPNDIKIPMMHGLYDGFYITHENMHEWAIKYSEVKESVADDVLNSFGPMDFSEW